MFLECCSQRHLEVAQWARDVFINSSQYSNWGATQSVCPTAWKFTPCTVQKAQPVPPASVQVSQLKANANHTLCKVQHFPRDHNWLMTCLYRSWWFVPISQVSNFESRTWYRRPASMIATKEKRVCDTTFTEPASYRSLYNSFPRPVHKANVHQHALPSIISTGMQTQD